MTICRLLAAAAVGLRLAWVDRPMSVLQRRDAKLTCDGKVTRGDKLMRAPQVDVGKKRETKRRNAKTHHWLLSGVIRREKSPHEVKGGGVGRSLARKPQEWFRVWYFPEPNVIGVSG
jgi:hypothetical protein